MGRIEREKNVVAVMIRLYCGKKHGESRPPCKECGDLLRYAHKKLENCRYNEKKTSCRRCRTHCYREDMRHRMKKVMGYSGPRMVGYKPMEWLKHLFQ